MDPNEQKAWESLCDKWSNHGYASLSEPEKVWFNIRSLIDMTNNGGLISYYYNRGADNLDDCQVALRGFGANEILSALEQLNTMFPSGVPKERAERNAIISSLPDDPQIETFLRELDDAVEEPLEELEEKLLEFIYAQKLVE